VTKGVDPEFKPQYCKKKRLPALLGVYPFLQLQRQQPIFNCLSRSLSVSLSLLSLLPIPFLLCYCIFFSDTDPPNFSIFDSLNHHCEVPFAMQDNIFIGSRDRMWISLGWEGHNSVSHVVIRVLPLVL
jgi:hypothetical protein